VIEQELIALIAFELLLLFDQLHLFIFLVNQDLYSNTVISRFVKTAETISVRKGHRINHNFMEILKQYFNLEVPTKMQSQKGKKIIEIKLLEYINWM